MQLEDHFRMLARYNRIANQRLYAACAQLDDGTYREVRAGSFGSIHALLNHILLADLIWMARFDGQGQSTPPLDTVLHDRFNELRTARAEQDTRIEAFFAELEPEALSRSITYTNSRGEPCFAIPPLAFAHMFNHQTHHRGQVHTMLSQTTVRPPALDLHLLIQP